MGRYFFDITMGNEDYRDSEGAEFDNHELAEEEAVAALLETVRDEGMIGSYAMTVRDEHGTIVLTATLKLDVSRPE